MNTRGGAEPEERAVLAPGSSATSLEQVREILFGAQHRDLTRRLARTDVHFAAMGEEIRREVARRLDLLDSFIRSELEGLTRAGEAHRSAQSAGLEHATREARDGIRSLDQRVAKLEEAMARTQHDFRQQLLDQAKSFVEEVRRARDELGGAIERELLVAWGETLEPTGPPGQEPAAEAERGEAWQRPKEAA
jgi:hypothetical protein